MLYTVYDPFTHRWLLHDPDMKLRTRYAPFLSAVARYFDHLFEILNPLQASYGGPIIAFQVENEYLSYSNDKEYINEIYNVRDDQLSMSIESAVIAS